MKKIIALVLSSTLFAAAAMAQAPAQPVAPAVVGRPSAEAPAAHRAAPKKHGKAVAKKTSARKGKSSKAAPKKGAAVASKAHSAHAVHSAHVAPASHGKAGMTKARAKTPHAKVH